MDCKRNEKILSDAAWTEAEGGALPADLRAHLAVCACCRETLERARRLVAVMDRGIRDTVAAEPSPEFAARVLRRVQQERASAQRWQAGFRQ